MHFHALRRVRRVLAWYRMRLVQQEDPFHERSHNSCGEDGDIPTETAAAASMRVPILADRRWVQESAAGLLRDRSRIMSSRPTTRDASVRAR